MQSISIIIPAYNEEKRLPSTLARVIEYVDSQPLTFAEILVVDDGSRDGTVAAVSSLSARHPIVRVLRNPGNRGKGYSVRHAMLEAKGEWALFTDADLSSPIEELHKLVAAAARDSAQVAIGSRALDRSLVGVHQPLFREYAGRFFNLVMRIVTGLEFHDTQCGFKLFQTAAARRIFALQQLERFGFDAEVLYIARRLGYRITEVPVRWNDVAGSKVGTLQGLNGFADLARIRFNAWTGKYKA
ncbi:MAG TPA: dolichyl-phosphate beta-glucosyltransferase [Bryobacteraceae bacterium]|nr:dolichyl-phosphate beta-glucosyltransferase [Bryobacteraceae bacterium]